MAFELSVATKNNGPAEFSTHVITPYVMYTATPSFNSKNVRPVYEKRLSEVVTDKFGFRNDFNLEQVKADNEYRIFFLGDSVAFNGDTNNTTICGFLSKFLNDRYKKRKFICYNAAIVSSVSDQHLATLVHHVYDFSPDLVIVFGGFGEVLSRFAYDPRIGYPHDWESVERALNVKSSIAQINADLGLWQHAAAHSESLTWFFPQLDYNYLMTAEFNKSVQKTYPSPAMGKVVEHYLKNLKKMFHICEAIGCKMFSVLNSINPKLRNSPTAYAADFYNMLTKAIAAQQKEGLPFFSLDRLFDSKEELFWDSVHTGDDGNAIYAENLLRIMTQDLKLL